MPTAMPKKKQGTIVISPKAPPIKGPVLTPGQKKRAC